MHVCPKPSTRRTIFLFLFDLILQKILRAYLLEIIKDQDLKFRLGTRYRKIILLTLDKLTNSDSCEPVILRSVPLCTMEQRLLLHQGIRSSANRYLLTQWNKIQNRAKICSRSIKYTLLRILWLQIRTVQLQNQGIHFIKYL